MKTCDRDSCTNVTANARFCSKRCSAKVTNSEVPRRRRIRNRTESCYFCRSQLKNTYQSYCDTSCQAAYKRAYMLNTWLSGDSDAGAAAHGGRIAGWAREHLISLRGEACELCGWDDRHPRTGRVPLEFDHIDGDRTNNRPENFKLLCPNHHALTATWGFTNRA